MSDVNQATDATPPAAPKHKRKYVRRAKPAARQSVPPPPPSPIQEHTEFDGLTASVCCGKCVPKDRKRGIPAHCVISCMRYCAHPHKGGLQSISMTDHAAIKRFAQAKAYLKHQAIDKR
jgi:hypothetical protein